MLCESDGPGDSSFVFSVTEGTPSPRTRSSTGALPKKYNLRDSGVVLSDEEDQDPRMGFGFGLSGSGSTSGEFLSVMPRASTSVSSLYSDGDEGLVTPGAGPGMGSGWPEAGVVVGSLLDEGEIGTGVGRDEGGVDAFILRTLVAGAGAGGKREGKRVPPGTPVKKVRAGRLGVGERPWQSAVASKVGGEAWARERKVPRKSLPAAFPGLGKKGGGSGVDLGDTDSEEGEDVSPSWRRKERYGDVGLGRPSARAASKENERGQLGTRGSGARGGGGWLMRRSSSGAFSFGSGESVIGTPTGPRERGECLCPLGRFFGMLTLVCRMEFDAAKDRRAVLAVKEPNETVACAVSVGFVK
jgi:mitosis inhibitor protein kinase SWE1